MSATEAKKLSFRRYENGDKTYDDFTDKIFNAGHTHKCPTYIHKTPPCQGSCPVNDPGIRPASIVHGDL